MREPDVRSPVMTGSAADGDPLRQMAESAPLGIVQTDARPELVFVNQRWREITGVTDPLPLPVQVSAEAIHPDDRERVLGEFMEAHRNLEAFETETRILRPDGSVVTVRIQSSPVLAEDGTFLGHVGTLLDITAQLETTSALRLSEQRYRNLMARAPVGQVVYTLDGTMVEINQAGAALLGYVPDELLATKADDYLFPDDRPLVGERLRTLIDGEVESIQFEHRLLHRDGHAVWVDQNITLERSPTGEALHFHTLTIDVTERKEAEDALRRSETRYRKLIDEAPVGQLISRLDGELVEANAAFLEMMGSTREELFGRDPLALLHRDDALAYRDEVERLLAGEIDTIDRERRLIRRRGHGLGERWHIDHPRGRRDPLPLRDGRHHRAQGRRGPPGRERGQGQRRHRVAARGPDHLRRRERAAGQRQRLSHPRHPPRRADRAPSIAWPRSPCSTPRATRSNWRRARPT